MTVTGIDYKTTHFTQNCVVRLFVLINEMYGVGRQWCCHSIYAYFSDGITGVLKGIPKAKLK